jgi:hypothetical protein
MVKKSLVAAVLASALLAVPTAGFAAQTITVDDKGATTGTATTTGSVSFDGGSLELTGLQESIAFANAGASTVFANGYDSSVDAGTATVLDNLGDGGTWKLSAKKGDWTADTASGASDKGASVLNDNATLAFTGVQVGKKDSNTTPVNIGKTDTQVATGDATDNPTDAAVTPNVKLGQISLHLDKLVNMRKGTYTNTITWTLSNTPGN